MDFSRHRIDQEALYKLYALADIDAAARITSRGCSKASTFINRTEDRAVLHVAPLRQPRGGAIGGRDIAAQVISERDRMLESFAESVRAGRIKGSAEQVAVHAHRQYRHRRLGLRTGHGLECWRWPSSPPARRGSSSSPTSMAVICMTCSRMRSAATTLFIVASKTFTTLETLTNAETRARWLK